MHGYSIVEPKVRLKPEHFIKVNVMKISAFTLFYLKIEEGHAFYN